MNFKSTAVLLLFVAIMLFTASCGKAEPSSSNPENTTAAAPESTSYYDTLGIPMYSGQKFTILCQTGSVGEIYAEAETGEVVNDAIYASNRSVEEHLGLDLGVLLVDGGWSNRKVFMESVSSSIMAGTDDFQMLMGYMNYMPTLILEHMFLNLNSLPVIDLGNPWWTEGFNDNATINGRMYMAMGDVCTSRLRTANCVFANSSLMEQYGYAITDLYTAVREGTWTFEKLTGLAQTASADLNGDGAITNVDRHGLGMTFMQIRAMTNAFAIDYTTRDAKGLPQIALYSDRFINAYDLMYKTIHTDWFYTAENNYTTPEDMIPKFKEDRMMFLVGYLGSTCADLRDMTSAYAVLPLAKYDEAQPEYRTECSDATSIIMVPNTIRDETLCGAVLECMNYEAYTNVTPAYFDTTLQGKYARDQETEYMMEVIRDSLYFDFGYIFAGVIAGDINKLMDSSVTKSSIASTWASKSPTMEQNLAQLIAFFSED